MSIVSVLLVLALDYTQLSSYRSFSSIQKVATPVILTQNIVSIFDRNTVRVVELTKGINKNFFRLPSSPVGTPCFHNGILYYYSENGFLVSYSIKEARILWKYSVKTILNTKPVVYNNEILIAYNSTNEILGIDIKTGKLLWSYKKDLPYSLHMRKSIEPIIKGSLLYTIIHDYIIVLDAKTGVPIVEKVIPLDNDNDTLFAIKQFNNGFLVSSYSGYLFYIDSNANEIWKFKSKHFAFYTQANTIFIADKNSIVKLDASGLKLAEYKLKLGFVYDLKIINNIAVIALESGIKAFELNKAKLIFNFNNNTGISKLITNGKTTILAQSNKNIFYLLKLQTGS